MPTQPALRSERTAGNKMASPVEAADRVVEFWREAGPSLCFSKDPSFDARFRERFLALHESAARGELRGWPARLDASYVGSSARRSS
jgi:uncharacterized protein (DUF924 family)